MGVFNGEVLEEEGVVECFGLGFELMREGEERCE
jgi:hypothetical protein